jgi:hypothetical protein
VKGLFDQTWPSSASERIAFAHLDCDWYDPVRYCLGAVADRLSPGGVMMLDELLCLWRLPDGDRRVPGGTARFPLRKRAKPDPAQSRIKQSGQLKQRSSRSLDFTPPGLRGHLLQGRDRA